ncbi:MAG: hypothetical protein ACLU5J_05635 [Christensenellales bacterium]
MQIIVIYILLIILFAIFKKVNAYDAFLEGVEESFKTVKNIFPNILAIIFAINVFINSGIMEILEKALSNVNIVPEIIMQCFLKPISWSSSLLLMSKIFEIHGVDSTTGMLSTLIQGGSDTTIYIVAFVFFFHQNEENRTYDVGRNFNRYSDFLICALFINFFKKFDKRRCLT